MSLIAPALLATAFNAADLHLFRTPNFNDGPLLSMYIFMLSILVFIIKSKFIQRQLNKYNLIIKFILVDYLIEILISDFWLNLEKFLLNVGPDLASFVAENLLDEYDYLVTIQTITQYLESPAIGYILSYGFSLFILITSLQATKVLNLHTLRTYGIVAFMHEIRCKTKKMTQRYMKRFGFGKKVRIDESKNSIHYVNKRGRGRRSSKCDCSIFDNTNDWEDSD